MASQTPTVTEPKPLSPAPALREVISAELPDIIALRRDLHAHPELMFEERRTAETVVDHLRAAGVEHKAGLAKGTGVLGHLPSTDSASETVVALRADMDALPIEEATGCDYTSTTPGVMHACGHDGHTAILVGAARVLSKIADRPNGVTFVFQPAEEGGAGGEKMCADGALNGATGGGLGKPVSRIFGLHGWPNMPLGTIATRPGPLLAATDDFVVTVRGEQAHAAYPHLGHDPIVASAHIVTQLQTIASRHTDPNDALVCTVGAIHSGTVNNVIPRTCQFIGTIRTLKPETRAAAKEQFFRIVEHGAQAMGCVAEIAWEDGYPATINDDAMAEHVFDIAKDAVGEGKIEVVEHATMGGEDFSYYGHHVPACFYLLGLHTGDPATEPTPQLHQPEFDFNDDAIATGIEMMCRLALAKA